MHQFTPTNMQWMMVKNDVENRPNRDHQAIAVNRCQGSSHDSVIVYCHLDAVRTTTVPFTTTTALKCSQKVEQSVRDQVSLFVLPFVFFVAMKKNIYGKTFIIKSAEKVEKCQPKKIKEIESS